MLYYGTKSTPSKVTLIFRVNILILEERFNSGIFSLQSCMASLVKTELRQFWQYLEMTKQNLAAEPSNVREGMSYCEIFVKFLARLSHI